MDMEFLVMDMEKERLKKALHKAESIIKDAVMRVGKEYKEEENMTPERVNDVMERILAAENCTVWMTNFERSALEMDIITRDDCIKELESKLKLSEPWEGHYKNLLKRWNEMCMKFNSTLDQLVGKTLKGTPIEMIDQVIDHLKKLKKV